MAQTCWAHWVLSSAIERLVYFNRHCQAADLFIQAKSALHFACLEDRLPVVKILLEAGFEVDRRDVDQDTPFTLCAVGDRLDVMKFLLSNGADINAQNERGFSALHVAVEKENEPVVRFLLQNKCNINIQDLSGHTPLHQAIGNESNKMVEILVCHPGTSFTKRVKGSRNGGYNAVQLAALRGGSAFPTEKIVQNAPHTINSQTEGGQAALHIAAIFGYTEIVSVLVKHNAYLDIPTADGMTPLMMAVMTGRYDIVELLVNKGARLDPIDKEGDNCLHYSAMGTRQTDTDTIEGSRKRTVEILRKKGYCIDETEHRDLVNKLASDGAAVEQPKIMRFLLRKGAKVNIQNSRGKTALHFAVNYLHAGHVRILIEHQADVNLQDEDGETPLLDAAVKEFKEIQEILCAHPKINFSLKNKDGFTVLHFGAVLGLTQTTGKALTKAQHIVDWRKKDGYTALQLAAANDKMDVAFLLLSQGGAGIDIQNNEKQTPLSLAISRNKIKMADFLLSKGADPRVQDSEGNTALHEAIANGSQTIIEKLIQHPLMDFTIVNNEGFNALQHAALRGNNHAVGKILVKAPWIVNHQKFDGFTALHLAAINGHHEVARTLLTKGRARVDIRACERQTPLIDAVTQHNKKIVELLVNHGANVNAAEHEGNTSLHLAVMRHADGNPPLRYLLDKVNIECNDSLLMDIAVFLCQHGANLHFRNRRGQTPLDLARDQATRTTLLRAKPASMGAQANVVSPGKATSPLGRILTEANTDSPGKSPTASSATPSKADVQSDELKKMHQKVEDLENSLYCVICEERPRAMAFGCGHTACKGCAQPLKDCHICRRPIKLRINLFNN